MTGGLPAIRVGVALLLLLLTGTAGAHADGLLAAFDIAPGADGLLLETTFGWVHQDAPGGPFTWTCHEGITSPDARLSPRLARSSEDVWLATVADLAQVRDAGESVYRTTDNGCSWEPPTGLSGHTISALAFDPDDPSRAVAVTADPSGDNGVFSSSDAGLSWSPTPLAAADREWTGLVIAGGAVWTTSASLDAGEAWVHRSVDAGDTWDSHPIDLTPWADRAPLRVRVLTASPSAPDQAWVVVGSLDGDALLHITEGGARQASVFDVVGDLVDAAVDADGAVWLSESGQRLHRAPDGRTFAEEPEAVPGVGVATLGTDVYIAAYADLTGQLLATGPAGGPYETLLRPQDIVGPATCPEGTDHARACSGLWSDLYIRLQRYTPATDTGLSGDGDSGGSGKAGAGDSDCGCNSAPGLGLGWLIGALGRR
ncbi:MAG: hypothetical protein ACI8PZ_004735 [Myxococcota bacterium]